MEIIWLLNSSSVPDISLLRIHSPISLPARVAAVSGGARMSNGRRWCSPSSWSIRHGHLPALITVTDLSTIAVSQLCARWRWWLCSSHGFKVFWIAVEPWTFSARSRAIFLWIRFIVKAVASAKKIKNSSVAVHSQLEPIRKFGRFTHWNESVCGKSVSSSCPTFVFVIAYLSKLLDCPADVCGYRFRSLGLKSLKRFCCRLL